MAPETESIVTTPAWSVAKLEALLDSPTPSESPSLLSALTSIPVSPGGKLSLQALTSDIEKRTIEETQKVLDLFKGAQKAIDGVVSEVKNMEKDVEGLLGRLKSAKEETGIVVDTMSDLKRRVEEMKWKEKVVKNFVQIFDLTEKEKRILERHDDQHVVDDDYLNALKKLESIHNHSKLLLLRCSNQKLGLDILTYSSTMRESCYETIYKFIQMNSASLENDSVPKLLTSSIIALKPRPMLLKYCAEEIASSRRALLVTRFVNALTKGGKDGIPRPIELHAHDPLRYTNDMLAWMHQALASEKELVFRLFGDCADVLSPSPSGQVEQQGEMESKEQIIEEKKEEEEKKVTLATKVLNTIFGALIRPFRVRFEQALEPTPPVVTLFKLATLLEFYANLMGKLLETEGGLVDVLMECNSITMYSFFSTWKHKMASFKDSNHRPTENLVPPPAVSQSMSRLEDIMSTMDTSLATEDARRGQIAAVLEVILTPLQSLCESLSKSLSSLERAIYMANCVNAMRAPLQGHSYVADRVEALTARAKGYIDTYIQLATSEVLRKAGLYERVQRLREAKQAFGPGNDPKDSSTISPKTIPGMDIESLSISIKNFYAMLFSGSGESLEAPGVNRITNVKSRNRARIAVANEIVNAHDELHKFVDGMVGGERVGMRDPKKVKIVVTGRV